MEPMTMMMMFQGFGNLASGILGADAQKKQGDYQRFIADINANLAEKQAAEIEARGSEESLEYMKKVRGMVGTQKARAAASGVVVGAGSSAQVMEETMEQGGLDAMRIKSNAYKEAYGVRMNAISGRAQGQFNQIASRNEANATLLAGGMKAAGNFAEAYGSWKTTSGGGSSVGKYVPGQMNIK